MPNTKLTTLALALGIFILVVALILTPLIDASNTPATETGELIEGNSTTIENHFRITLNNATDTTANITVADKDTLVGERQTLSPTNSSTVNLPGGDVTITVTDISTVVVGTAPDPDTHTVTYRLDYSRTYPWTDAGILFVAQFDILLTLVGFMIMMATLIGVLSQ